MIKKALEKGIILLALFGATEFTVIHNVRAQDDDHETVKDAKQDAHLQYEDERINGILETQRLIDERQRAQDKRMEHDESLVIGIFLAIGALQSIGVFKGALERIFSHAQTSSMSITPKE